MGPCADGGVPCSPASLPFSCSPPFRRRPIPSSARRPRPPAGGDRRAGWDTLNVRAGPGTGYSVLGTVGPHADDLVATGRVGFLTQLCRVACDQYRAGVPGFADIVERDCRARSRIWYELRTPRGLTGWSSARYLDVRPPASRPPGIIIPPHLGATGRSSRRPIPAATATGR